MKQKKVFALLILMLLQLQVLFYSVASSKNSGFKARQLLSSRVRTAYSEKEAVIKSVFEDRNVEYPPEEIFLRIFKRVYENGSWTEPGELELWARDRKSSIFTHIKTYRICSSSGALGPKRRAGDGQVPEGFYAITSFNPASSFYLSLKVGYPNASDKILGVRGNLGGDIYIHGNCVTVGCIPMTDDIIKELYVAAVDTKNNGGRPIRCDIFPLRMDQRGTAELKRLAGGDVRLYAFWENLRQGYALFEKTRVPPAPYVDARGRYIFSR